MDKHPIIASDTITSAMAAAIAAARAFEGATAPNPPVGCVLLDEQGAVISTGAHERAGQAHAEAQAIARAREAGLSERIHTAVVTLEPCNHHGRTPPCTEAILATPARQVWIGCADPNPKVKGSGAATLAARGLNVTFFTPRHDEVIATGLQRLIGPFAKRTSTGLPWVTVKQAVNREGSMVPPQGQKTFTSAASLTFAHELRRRADAILTGSGTVLADDPHFTVRHVPDFTHKRRHLVLLDRRRRIPESYVQAAEARGFSVLRAGTIEDGLRQCAERGALEVLVEAGPAVTEAILSGSLWDEHVVIRQQAGGDDIITIHRNSRSTWELHVFRHH
ncbi:MAG: bifunctional diaminohydroxyphosphoribosylaminopyrimidine deaminase/5-amino-6-(5-phosphoribosylamino)uracil reductase RibD [Proteobacteria bacterium]|nr:bifunctional diaminohydroxyphosphoribosylaminopyrimidine deaminase/5-amino-6-(5-phosphoribosylamino)uracil reductase RibD [Pseudomonadota bacterium]